MCGSDAAELSREFTFSRRINPNVQRVVYHASLSVPASEKLSDEKWRAISQRSASRRANDYLQGMGFNANQYVMVKHSDTQHNHVHIVASRIRMTDGSCVSDSWDYKRSERLLRQLESKYQLSTPIRKHIEKRSPTTGEQRMKRRTGENSVREKIQNAIDLLSKTKPRLPELIQQLSLVGINTRLKITRNGIIQGISYELEDIAFRSSKLGKAYSLNGLQKYRLIDFDPQRDLAALRAFNSKGDRGVNFADFYRDLLFKRSIT